MWRHNSSASLNTAPASAAAASDSSSAPMEVTPAPVTTTAPASSTASSSSTAQSAVTSASDDTLDGLPPGWTRKESKTQKGRYYYISPAGKTQWTPPSLRSRATSRVPLELPTFNWVNEVEIEFGEGRLGVSLREVRQYESTPYPLFQAEVDDLPKINGKAGPAELYNWSVKPHKRLTIGMRVSGIEDLCLAGLTYKEVVDRLKKAPRPLRIRFADVEKGTVEDHPELALRLTELEPSESGAQSSAYLQQKQEYTRVLVTSELHTELWTIETKKLLRSMAVMKKKWDAVSSEFDVLNERRLDLRKENERLVSEKQKYETMMKHLKLQEIHAMENPELVKANALAKRNASLTEDIAKMSAGNKRLRKERVTLQSALDEVEGVLAKLDAKAADDGEPDKSGDDEFFGIDLTAPASELLAAFKKKMRFMEEELSKEQRKATKVQREMDQLNRHLNNLSTSSTASSSSTSSSSSKSRSEDKSSSSSASGSSSSSGKSSLSSSGSGAASAVSPEITRLEAKILELRKQQRSVVETMSKAAQVGDQDLAKECQRRRHAIKEELKHAQDELHRVKTEGMALPLSSSSSGRDGSSGSKPTLTTSASTVGTSSSSRSRKHSVNPALKSSSSVSSSSSSSHHQQQQQSEQPQRAKKTEKMPTLFGFLDKGPTEWSERGLIRNMKTMRGARERWCEITPDGFLKYYKRRGDPVVRGEIDLSDQSLEVVCEDTKRGREFVISTSEQQSHFFTKSTPELDKWVKTLRAAQKYLITNNQLDALMKKAEAADKRNNGTSSGMGHGAQQAIESFPEEDEQFYGRATLGF